MDLNIKNKIEQELTSLQKRLSDVEMFTLFSGDYDKNNCCNRFIKFLFGTLKLSVFRPNAVYLCSPIA